MKEYDDATLILLLADGDQQAFGVIYHRYAQQLMRYSVRRVGNKEECEELIQDIFESLWNRRLELQHVTALHSYLFTMMRYKIVDYVRRVAVRKKYEEHFLLFEAVYDHFNERTLDPSEIQERIDRGISTLPRRCQTAIRLRLNENLPYKEIARKMNISIKTVEKHISAALHHLRMNVKSC